MNHRYLNLFFLSLLIFFGGCKEKAQSADNASKKTDTLTIDKKTTARKDSCVSVKSLKALLAMPEGSVIDTCDLSRQQLTELPKLYRYKIKVLNLSHNKLKGKFKDVYLPSNLEVLDVSHNHLRELKLGRDFPKLKKVYCQYNKLISLFISPATTYVNASHNNLMDFDISTEKETELSSSDFSLSYLDLSHNPRRLAVRFNPAEIDTLILTGTPPLEQIGIYL